MQVERFQGGLVDEFAGGALAAWSSSSRPRKSLATTQEVCESGSMVASGVLSPGSPRTTQNRCCCLPGSWPRAEPTMPMPHSGPCAMRNIQFPSIWANGNSTETQP